MGEKYLHAQIDKLEKERKELRRSLSAKLDKVRTLHYPVEIEPSDTICHECSHQLPSGEYYLKVVEYPCSTLLAIGPEEDYLNIPRCSTHLPMQHRDGKPPWCRNCGLTQAGNEPESIFGKRNS